jgi:hypothetical protein
MDSCLEVIASPLEGEEAAAQQTRYNRKDL